MDTPSPTPTPAPQAQPAATPPSGNGTKILLIIVIVLLVLGVLGACASMVAGFVISKGIKKAIESAGVQIEGDNVNGGRISFTGQDGKKIEINGNDDSGSITITGEDGAVATFEGGANVLPQGFPAFPVPAQFAVKGSATQTNAEGVVYIVSWTGQGAPADIAAWYNTALVAAGWRVNGTTTTADGASLIFEKETTTETRDNGLVTIGMSDGATEVSVWLLDAK